MITITGATGALNGATVDHLLEHHDPAGLVVVARDPARAARFADLGVEVRHGDYAEPASLPAAFEGADQLLLVSSSDPAADAVALHRAAIDAAAVVGVGRVLYTSHQGASPTNPFGPCADHAATERLLEESGLLWTSLRNGFYAHSLAFMAGPWRETGVISVPGDGPVSWTARADAAEAAAVVLTSGATYDGPVTLTATAAPTFAELAAPASRVVGREIGFEVVEEEDWTAAQLAAGRPEPMVGFLLGFFRAAREGYFAGTDPLLGELLGREPRRAEDVLA
ncbi:NAD(P)H-binding protein [Nocardioides litoris]|uniref:NmrA family NAD(P)-binding protein n=1 Tax=Nocardioides litoris TaxID=1926648 RepID=UPI00111CF703|nr:NAD(P)H-binding protein [Nocardioides litoris]